MREQLTAFADFVNLTRGRVVTVVILHLEKVVNITCMAQALLCVMT